jgi:hemerythrin
VIRYTVFCNWFCNLKPKPQMIKYHEAFLKGYLELLLLRQQYGTIKVPRAINKSLNEWLHNQHTYIGDYKKQKAGTKFWDNKEDRYVNILNALGAVYVPRT